MFMFLFLFFSTLLLCSFFRLKELFQVKNGVTVVVQFYARFKFSFLLTKIKLNHNITTQNLGRSVDDKRRKKKRMAIVRERGSVYEARLPLRIALRNRRCVISFTG